MLRDLGDLGTPSAPPIIDIPNDERSNEVEDQQQQQQQQEGSEILTENDQWTCPSKCLADRMEMPKLGGRYSN